MRERGETKPSKMAEALQQCSLNNLVQETDMVEQRGFLFNLDTFNIIIIIVTVVYCISII